jgi:DNA-binding protein HU-beta
VGEVAREREDPVVRVGVEADRARAERGDEALDELDPLRLVRRQRGEEPGRAVEEVGRRARGAARRASGERVARHEPGVVDAVGEAALRRADVRDRRGRRRGEHLARGVGERSDGDRDDDELGPGDRGLERGGGVVERLRPGRLPQRGGVDVPAGDPRAGAAGGEGHRRADEPRAHDRDARDRGRRRPRGRCLRRGAVPAKFLLHDVEDGREDRLDAALGQRPCICGIQLAQELGLALGVDRRRTRLLLVLADTTDEVEAPVEGLQDGPVERADLVPQLPEVVHFGSFSWFCRPSVLPVRLNQGAHQQNQEVSMPLTQTQLADAVAEKAGLSRADAKKALSALEEVVLDEIGNAEKVKIGGVVQLDVRMRPATEARPGRNPATGEEITIAAKPASVAVKARPLAKAKNAAPPLSKVQAKG